MPNPNDATAFVYDIVNNPLKGAEVTDEEVDLIVNLLPAEGKVLDVGCGTGRHAVLLAQKGYAVTAIDSSLKMLTVLKQKAPRIKVLNKDIYEARLKKGEYDLAILMWNTFNELALTMVDAKSLLDLLRSALKPGGGVLINIDKSSNLKLRDLHFHTSQVYDGLTYEQDWEVVDFEKRTNTTVSKETITIVNKLGQKNAQFVSYIRQRWWGKKDIYDLAKNIGALVETRKIRLNDEYYFCFTL